MEDKIVIKESGVPINQNRFANRIEPVDDKEVNVALFSLYDWLIAPVKDIEAEVNRIKANKSEIRYIDGRSHHSVIKFIVLFIMIFVLSVSYIDGIEQKAKDEYKASTELQEKYGFWSDYSEAKNPDLYEYAYGWNLVLYPAYASITIVVLLYILERKHDKRKIKKIEEKNNDIHATIEKKALAIKKEVSFVPPQYRHSRALQYFVESYENSRINNLYEAVNAYDTFEHRKNVEGTLLEIHETLQRIEYLKAEEIGQLKAIRRDIWLSGAMFN